MQIVRNFGRLRTTADVILNNEGGQTTKANSISNCAATFTPDGHQNLKRLSRTVPAASMRRFIDQTQAKSALNHSTSISYYVTLIKQTVHYWWPT